MLRVVCILLAVLATPVNADVFAYTDPQGVEHFTNAPENNFYQHISSLLEEPGMHNRGGVASLKENIAVFAPHIEQAAAESGVDAALVHAVITAESGYNPKAVSRAGAQGLMQLMPATARRYAVKDVFDPRQNIRGGTRYLRDLLNLFGNDLELTVAAYNAGENAVVRSGMRIPPYRETRLYVPKVLRLYNKYKTLL